MSISTIEQSTTHTSDNWILPVSTRSLAFEHKGTECFTTGWRFMMSDVWKGAAELKSYLRAAIVMPTCKENNIQASCMLFQKLKL